MKFNNNFNNLKKNYLFVDMARKTKEYKLAHPNEKIIKLGIGDVTLPLCSKVIEEMHNAVDEMQSSETFKGYGPYDGYDFLKEAICNYYKKFGVKLSLSEIYISDGSKGDTANLPEIFEQKGNVLIPNPTYPVYVDSNIIRGKNIFYINANEENEFLPLPDYKVNADIIYLCSPNNPTGAVYNKEQLKKWIDYALEKQAIILFDAAYESFIENDSLPHSIFEIDGAKKCAIEICSFSKNAGFTGMRCGYVVIPNDLMVDNVKVGDMWLRRQSIKFNGVSYITQRGACAALSEAGQAQIKENIFYYKENAKIISSALESLNIWHIGGKNSPYIWFKCPNNMNSWEFFDLLLDKAHVVGTPGSGFGSNGEGFFRLSSFGKREDVLEAVERIKKLKF